MSVVAVAKKDFQDAIRSRWLWILSVLFVLVFAAPAIARFYFGIGGGQGAEETELVVQAFIQVLKEVTAPLIPLIAIVVSYASITREQESGTLKLLLSLPHSRQDVVLGKVLGRAAVVVVPIVVGFVIAALVLLPAATGFAFVTYLAFAYFTALLGVVFVCIAVGISAIARTDRQAMVGSVGAYFVALLFWNTATSRLAHDGADWLGWTGQSAYLLELGFKLLNPIEAYKTLVDSLVTGSQLAARQQVFGFFLFPDPAAAEALGDELPVLFTDPFVVGFMVLWMILPVFLGLVVFQRRDL